MANVPVTLQCSFCGKSQHEVKKLIAGPTVYICDECIGLCNDIIAEEVGGDAWEPPERLQPVLGLLIRVGDVLRTLRERAEEPGLAQWERTIEDLLRAQESKAAVKAPGPAA
jgi:hypothetical protein